MPTIAHPRTARTVGVILALAVMAATLGLAQPARASSQPKPAPVTAPTPPPPPQPMSSRIVCCKGPGYALIYDPPATVKIVFTKAVRDWLSVSVLEGCKPCLMWVLVNMAKNAMPEKVLACVRIPIIGNICSPTIHIRDPFIYDSIHRIDEAYNAIGLAKWYYNDCFFWRATGGRYFSHTTTGCRA